MGCNYYVKLDRCKTCGNSSGEIHVGKSSYGWKFTFNLNRRMFYSNFKELKQWLKDKDIYDEYDKLIPHKEFYDLVRVKQKCVDPEDDSHCMVIEGYKFLDCDFS